VSHPNFLLSSLSPASFAALSPHLAVIKLEHKQVLAESHETLRRVYFPHSGILSAVVDTIGGGAIETGMIGKDGVFGAAQALDRKVSLNRVVVQVEGEASVIDGVKLREIAVATPEILEMLIRYDQFFLAQVQQTAACNGLHTVRQRFGRWLLRMEGLVGPDFTLTQEFLAQMMGVRRTSVTDVAKELQASGLIIYRRGHVRIIDLERLRGWACECEADLADHHRRLFDPNILDSD
jgi:CRP-like cAMP-binding protein